MVRKNTPQISAGMVPLPTDFPSSLVVRVTGGDLNPELAQEALEIISPYANSFVEAQRQAKGFTANDFYKKTTVIGDYMLTYMANGDQELLQITINPQPVSGEEKEEKEEEDKDKKCLLILHGTNKITATDMLGVGPGKVGPVVHTATLTKSDFSLVEAPAETSDWTEAQWEPKTLQMTNSKKMGPCVVTSMKIEDFVITQDYRYNLWRIGITDVQTARLAVSSLFALYPTLNANDTTIYADRHSFSVSADGSLVETSASVWGEADYWTQATLMHSSLLGSPRYIDSNFYAHYWFALMFMDEVVDVSINQNGSSFYDINAPEAYYPPTIDIHEVNNELRRRSVGGGLTQYIYPDTTFPFPYLTQIDGVDILNTQYCSIAGSSTNIDTKIIKYMIEGQLLDSWNWMSSDKDRLSLLSFPYPHEPSRWTVNVSSYNTEFIDDTTTYYGDAIGWGVGRCAVANGEHYFQMWATDDPPTDATCYMDAEDCKSDLEKAIKGAAKDVKAVYMDVPLSWIKKLK